MPRVGKRLYLLRGEPPKSYYKGHGFKKVLKTATIFSIDCAHPDIYSFNVLTNSIISYILLKTEDYRDPRGW